MPTSAIAIQDLSLSYGTTTALDTINLKIPQGSRCALVGPNGAGKSTLFKAILGLEKPSSGKIQLLGQSENLSQTIEQSVAYIPQSQDVNWRFPATVSDIVMMGRFAKIKGWFKRPDDRDRALVNKALEQMRLSDLRDRQIDQLSGGQRQRVFIARALVQEADLYMMDEPLAGIDNKTETLIMEALKTFQAQGKTSIVIHHDLQSLPHYFDYLVWINKSIVAAGPISEVLTQENYQKTYQSQAGFVWGGPPHA